MHQNRSHHHGTAEGSFTAKKWFGHRAGRSPCAHSIGKFFLCYIVLFSSETSTPGSPGNYLDMDDILYICMCQSIFRNLGTLSFTLQMVLKCFTFLGPEVCAKLLLFNPMLLTTSPQADQLGTFPTRVKAHFALDLQRQPNMIYLDVRLQSMKFEMVLSKNTFCWKNLPATCIFPTRHKSIMLCDVDVSCVWTQGRCHVMLTHLALTHGRRRAMST